MPLTVQLICEITCYVFEPYCSLVSGSGWGRSGTMGGRSRGCFFWVLFKRSIPKPDQHRKDIRPQELLGIDVIGTEEQQLLKIPH